MAKIKLCSLAEVPVGSLKAVVTPDGKEVLVCRTSDGTISVMDDRCSHADVQLSGGALEGEEIECPAHGARFNCKSGKATCMPAVTAVKVYASVIDGDAVFVYLD